MARRKNVKRIDPRYFLNETVLREGDEGELAQADEQLAPPGIEEGFGTALRGLAGAAKGAVGKLAGHGPAAEQVQQKKQIQALVADMLKTASPETVARDLQSILAPILDQVKQKEEEF